MLKATTFSSNRRAHTVHDCLRAMIVAVMLPLSAQAESSAPAIDEGAKKVDPPTRSAACDSADRRLPARFSLMQTDNFVLFSDTGQALTVQQARWVERTYQEFQRFAKDCGLRPQPLRYKLVCVLFEHRNEYQAFAQMQDGMANPLFTGYYSPRSDRVVFSLEPDSGRETAEDRTAAQQDFSDAAQLPQSRSVLGFNSQHDDAPEHAAHRCDAGDTAAKCVHETIHQLMFHTRLMSPDVQYPLWICEGLSTAFETNAPDEPFGPDRDFAPRRDVFRSMLSRGELMPLRELVTMTQLWDNQPRTTRVVYNQSYALVGWLCRNRPEQVRDYLQAMLNEPSGRLPASRHLEIFENVFGAVESLEREWLHSESVGDTITASR